MRRPEAGSSFTSRARFRGRLIGVTGGCSGRGLAAAWAWGDGGVGTCTAEGTLGLRVWHVWRDERWPIRRLKRLAADTIIHSKATPSCSKHHFIPLTVTSSWGFPWLPLFARPRHPFTRLVAQRNSQPLIGSLLDNWPWLQTMTYALFFINVVRLRSINIKSIIYCLVLSHNHYQAKISTKHSITLSW